MNTDTTQCFVTFDWFELFELYCLLECFGTPEENVPALQLLATQLKDLVDRSELEQESSIFLLELVEQEKGAWVFLRGDVLANLAHRLEKRLHEEPYPDGEHPDFDLLDVLLPLQQKLQESGRNREALYRIARDTGQRIGYPQVEEDRC